MKKDLNEQISRIKNMMGKIMNESYDDFDTQIQPEERPEFDNMSVNDLNEDMVPDGRETLRSLKAVSYTHLTLPTICSV